MTRQSSKRYWSESMATAKIVKTDPDVELVIRGRAAANLRLLLGSYIGSDILEASGLHEVYDALNRIDGDLPNIMHIENPFKDHVFIHEDEIR